MATNRLPRRAETTDPAGPVRPTLSKESEIAGAIKALVLAGQRDTARERFGELVTRQQRRALRIAYQYLRDVHDADEAVQDAFVKVFTHITTYREELGVGEVVAGHARASSSRSSARSLRTARK